jgi:hypothetical protein
VIFRVGKSKLRKPKLFWGDEEIEIVDKYAYLGVPMNGNMSYSQISDNYVPKGMQAQRALCGLFFKAYIKNLDVRLYLFECLVKSVLFYCCQIWGVSLLHGMKSFQIQFLRLFRLPKYLQIWFLMLESQSKSIHVSFLKNLLFFVTKIMSRPKDSIIRKCFDYMKSSVSKVRVL